MTSDIEGTDSGGEFATSGPSLRTECPLCGSRFVRVDAVDSFSPCHACSGLIRLRLPSEAELSQWYSLGWRDPEVHTSETGATGRDLADDYVSVITRALGLRDLTGQAVLDFGAGKGKVSTALKRRNAEVQAIEPYGLENLGELSVKAVKSLHELPQGVVVDGIVMIQVIEHLPNPVETLRSLSHFLRTGGFLFVATPNAFGARARLVGHQWSERKKLGHLQLFTQQSLSIAFDRAGFARTRRVRGFLRYTSHSLRSIAQFGLQALGLDGDLRMIAWKS